MLCDVIRTRVQPNSSSMMRFHWREFKSACAYPVLVISPIHEYLVAIIPKIPGGSDLNLLTHLIHSLIAKSCQLLQPDRSRGSVPGFSWVLFALVISHVTPHRISSGWWLFSLYIWIFFALKHIWAWIQKYKTFSLRPGGNGKLRENLGKSLLLGFLAVSKY